MPTGTGEAEQRSLIANPLVETNIFSRVQRNAYIKADPPEINFPIPDSCCYSQSQKRFKLINIGTLTTRVNIIPPETPYFKLNYEVPEQFVPGSFIRCHVKFIPTENRRYEDVIRIHTEDNDRNLVVPLCGYPGVGQLEFPGWVRFCTVPIGKPKVYEIPLRSSAAVDFEYTIEKVRDHPCFEVQPVTGVLKAKQTQLISVRFTPTEYTTCTLQLCLKVAQLDFKPKFCTIYGYSRPGLESQRLRMSSSDVCNFIQPKTQSTVPTVVSTARCVYPARLKRSQQPQKLCPFYLAKLLTGPHRSPEQRISASRRQKQLLAFEAKVKEDEVKELRNHVKWQSTPSERLLTGEEKEGNWILSRNAWNNYLHERTDLETYHQKPPPELCIPLQRTTSPGRRMRFYRPAQQTRALSVIQPSLQAQKLTAAGWIARACLLERLICAVTHVIIRIRAQKRLKLLQTTYYASNNTDDKEDTRVFIPGARSREIGEKLPPSAAMHRVNYLPTGRIGKEFPCENADQGVRRLSDETTIMDKHVEMLSAVPVTPHIWPLFKLEGHWFAHRRECDVFDTIEAKEIVYWALNEQRLENRSVLPLMETKLKGIMKSEDNDANSNDFLIKNVDESYNVGGSISLAQDCLKLRAPSETSSWSLNTSFKNSNWTKPVIYRSTVDGCLDKQRNETQTTTSKLSGVRERKLLADAPLMPLKSSLRTRVKKRLFQYALKSSRYHEMVPLDQEEGECV